MADQPTDQRTGLENAQRELNIIRWLLTILAVLEHRPKNLNRRGFPY